MKIASVLAVCLFVCTGVSSAQTRAAFSVEALVADAPAYVASRYAQSELPSALVADLTAASFTCQHSASGSECTRSREASPVCFDVVRVDITADAVTADQNRLCMGAEE
ncbi:MAG: hypothetical protein ABL932_12595 [Terricaulis sp.]